MRSGQRPEKGFYIRIFTEKGKNLFHIGIYETDSANYFFFDIAHIMGDGMTMNVLFEDLNQLYLGKAVEPGNLYIL